MDDEEFNEFLTALDSAADSLRQAARLMDGDEGFAPGGEHAYVAASSAIDALREIEVAYRGRADTRISPR